MHHSESGIREAVGRPVLREACGLQRGKVCNTTWSMDVRVCDGEAGFVGTCCPMVRASENLLNLVWHMP